MKILYYDCFSGISGDMNLAAMVDLGVDRQYLLDELKKLNLNGYDLKFFSDQRKGISGTRVDVILDHHHSHPHTHAAIQQNEISLSSNNGLPFDAQKLKVGKKDYGHSHEEHRNLNDIAEIINKSTLSSQVKKLSLDIFYKIAVAEAHIHGKTLEEVHFHEVGAVDSIVDIVGAAICFDWLKPDKVICSPVQLGGGFVKCAHGTFPVPAPATFEILKGIPVKSGAVQVETTTPTGAAIIATLANEFTDQPNLSIEKIAYGIGHRDNAIPNVLRVCLAEVPADLMEESAWMLECNIDDMNPEMYEFLMEKLFETGADDVFFQPIIMKKSRPAITLSVLVKPDKVTHTEHLLFTETSTLGIRKYKVTKRMLHREFKILETKWGSVSVKTSLMDGKPLKSKPEYADCVSISKKYNVPLMDVYKEVTRLLQN